MEQKRAGKIRHLGFSAHGSIDVMKRFLDAYGKDMEFCQIQLNWLDWKFQDAEGKVKLLREHNIPVWVMEPLRGGRLARLSDEEAAKLAALRPDCLLYTSSAAPGQMQGVCIRRGAFACISTAMPFGYYSL